MLDALRNTTVVDLSDNVAGQFCGRLLADQGADVVLVEPPEGSKVRTMWPRVNEQSFTFENVNRGKRSLVIDPHSVGDRQLLDATLDRADIVIAGADYVAPANRRYALARVSEFGASGSLHHWQGTEMINQALSGVMYETGKAFKKPLYGCGYRSYYAAGTVAYISVISELLAYRAGRRRQDSEVQVAEAAATMNYCRATQYDYSGLIDRRGGTKRPMAFVKCKDYWVCIFPAGASWRPVCEALGADELIDDPRLQTSVGRGKHWKEIVDVFEQKVADRTAEDVVAAVQGAGGVSSRTFDPEELLHAEHLDSRGYWTQTESGRLTLGPMFRIQGVSPRVPTDAPVLAGGSSVGVTR